MLALGTDYHRDTTEDQKTDITNIVTYAMHRRRLQSQHVMSLRRTLS
jgi:hypothetical protein